MAILSILIPTLVCRRTLFNRLMTNLLPQCGETVDVLKLEDDGEQTTGQKRQRLLEAARSPYVCFVDDDDLVSDDYCDRIREALSSGPDVVGFKLRQFDDAMQSAEAVHSVKAERWWTQNFPDRMPLHFRTPNHLNPVRREMALAVGFRPLNVGEDSDFSRRLYEKFPDMREVFIDAFIYDYLRRSGRENERTNDNPRRPH